MKKIAAYLLTFTLLLSVFAFNASANSGITVYVNESVLQCDVAPFIYNGRTMVPMRKIFEAYGATVDWNNDTRTITANTGTSEIKLCIGDYTLYNNGVAETMDVAPMIVNDRTFVPVRAISQSLGLPVEWFEATQSVYINSPAQFALAQLNAAKALEDIVITVDGIEYSQADYNLTYMSIYQNVAQQYGMYFGAGWEEIRIEEGITILDMIQVNATEQVKQMAAILKIAEEKGITADAEAETSANYQLAALRANLGNEEAFKTFLAEMKTTEEALKKYYEFYFIFNSLVEKLTQPGQEAYVEKASLQKEFSENYWTVQHILVSTEPGADEMGNITPARTKEEAESIIKEIYARLRGGASFADLIEEYNEDPGMTKDSFYTFSAGRMVPEFEENSKALKVGEYSSEAVVTDYGYHIIKKYETDLNSVEFQEFAQVKEQTIINDMIQKKVASLTFDIKAEKISTFLNAWSAER